MRCISAAEVERHFVHSWVFDYVPPAELIADHGGGFMSNFFYQLMQNNVDPDQLHIEIPTTKKRTSREVQQDDHLRVANVCRPPQGRRHMFQ